MGLSVAEGLVPTPVVLSGAAFGLHRSQPVAQRHLATSGGGLLGTQLYFWIFRIFVSGTVESCGLLSWF